MKHRDPFIFCPACMPILLTAWAAACGLAVLLWWAIDAAMAGGNK